MTYGLLKTSCYKLNAKRFLFFYSHKTKLLKSKSVLPLQVYFHRFNVNANDVEIYLRKIAVLLQKLDSFWNIRWVTFTMDKIFCKDAFSFKFQSQPLENVSFSENTDCRLQWNAILKFTIFTFQPYNMKFKLWVHFINLFSIQLKAIQNLSNWMYQFIDFQLFWL